MSAILTTLKAALAAFFSFRVISVLLLILAAFSGLQAQFKFKPTSIFLTWGYNRAYYLPSTIQVQGPDLDLTFYDVIAKDDPEEFSDIYYDPTKFTIPQFDFRLGVNLPNLWRISGGWQHMKYQTTLGKEIAFSGFIGDQYAGGLYEPGTYENEVHKLTKGFFYMEHTDGLNYITLELEKGWEIRLGKDWLKLRGFAGLGTGPMTPWTDAFLLGNKYRNPTIHFAGWAVNISAKPELWISDYFFIQFVARLGQIKMWDVWIEPNTITAKQNISFFERNVSVGLNYPLVKANRSPSIPAE